MELTSFLAESHPPASPLAVLYGFEIRHAGAAVFKAIEIIAATAKYSSIAGRLQ
jgi:hypothetical protein